mmetsp:Transcript_31435/g.62917  ORF Transcript_31435/g.62917 Transcript_31435/m.62917 type:complete len:247 (-) Transcript_31435:7-747(-)
MCLSKLALPQIKKIANHNHFPTKPPRPYSEYNLFFQLEREYILQVLFNVKPMIEPSEIFSSSDQLYKGPPLPTKYQDLILPYDWYMPGKSQRRNRRHRKSHGKIGFLELSSRIAESWARLDKETRVFCACLSDIGMLQYKNAMRAYKMATTPSYSAVVTPIETPSYFKKNNDFEVDSSISSSNSFGSKQRYSGKENTKCPTILDFETEVSRYLSYLESRVCARTNQSVDLVDMDDDEIRRLWVSQT